MGKYYIILSSDPQNPIPFGLPIWRFNTNSAAIEKAQSLAVANPNCSFIVFEAQFRIALPMTPIAKVEPLI